MGGCGRSPGDPGRPDLYATTRKFLEDLRTAAAGTELPPLTEIERIMDLVDLQKPKKAVQG